jgi:tetratricopeptide (TPR) repeat protein
VRLLATLLVAALAAFGARRLGSAGTAQAPEPAAGAGDLEPILAEIQELRRENERLAHEVERRTGRLAAAQSPAVEVSEEEIGAALERWRAAQTAQARAAEPGQVERAPGATAGELDLASIPMPEIVQALANEGLTNLDRQELFQRLREVGRIDEYVAAIEALAAADPENAGLQVALGHAYLQKLFGVVSTPEAGTWAMKSDAAFDRALELDDHNWAARFSKAVALSNWPAFMGRGPEAIDHFETLLEQQAGQPKRDEFALTYLFLGNMQRAGGEGEQAVATWKAGLELFPDMGELRRLIDEAEASEPSGRPASR